MTKMLLPTEMLSLLGLQMLDGTYRGEGMTLIRDSAPCQELAWGNTLREALLELAQKIEDSASVIDRMSLVGRFPRLEILRPIDLAVQAYPDGSYTVSDGIFLIYGQGPSEGAAIHDYLESLEEYYIIMQRPRHLRDQDLLTLLTQYVKLAEAQ